MGGETAAGAGSSSGSATDSRGIAELADDCRDRDSRLAVPPLRLCLGGRGGWASARARGSELFVRQLCWRDFNHQLLAAQPRISTVDLRPRDQGWREDDAGFEAWRRSRTGFPLVDAGMRQLVQEGFMHNRARLVTGSFLTKHRDRLAPGR